MTRTSLIHDVTTIDGLDTASFGGKAAGLARMVALGMPVPPAFVIETAACRQHREGGGALPKELLADVVDAVEELETRAGKSFAAGGVGGAPLLVSVRSGSQVSMPGMMDTVLNLGLDVAGVQALAEACDDSAFAVDVWIRFWCMYADIVLDVDPEVLRLVVADASVAAAAELDADTATAMESAIVEHLRSEGCDVTTDPWQQLYATIDAVFSSWDSRRAKTYRAHHGIDDDLGTAVTVQAMVFGNLGSPSGSGVAFTRDPSTGRAELFGEYLPDGQGEDVVAGTRTPTRLQEAGPDWAPMVAELTRLGLVLESEYRDALDIEFTVEEGRLYLLQVRPAKRTADAALTIAVELAASDVITAEEALGRITAEQVATIVSPRFESEAVEAARARGDVIAHGIAASPGHASGVAVVDPDRAATLVAEGHAVILVRPTTSPQDLHGMIAAEAVVTQRGGATSHAAVVSRALDKPCVVGCEQIEVDLEKRIFTVDGRTFDEGAELSVDGATGEVFAGILPLGIPEGEEAALARVLAWADDISHAEVSTSGPEARAYRGHVVLGLLDVLASAGVLEEFVGAVDSYVHDAHAASSQVEDVIERVVREACTPYLSGSTSAIELRLPSLTSARARRLLGHWSALAPEQLVPLGSPRLLESYVRGVSEAADAAGHDQVTVMLAGIASADELQGFAELVEKSPRILAGGVLQSAAAVYQIEELAQGGRPLWIDLDALSRSVDGRSEEAFEILMAAGRTELTFTSSPLIALLLGRVTSQVHAASRVGLELARPTSPELTAELFDSGWRLFASPPVYGEQLRLRLAQHALKERSHG